MRSEITAQQSLRSGSSFHDDELRLIRDFGKAMPMHMECSHSGSSICSMHGEDCCLTESGKARVRTIKPMPVSGSCSGNLCNLQLFENDLMRELDESHFS